MHPYIQDNGESFYVVEPNSSFYLGPFDRKDDAQDVVDALKSAAEFGREEVRKGLRELIGVQVVHVGN